jgi:Flp pilus assembly protein TadD
MRTRVARVLILAAAGLTALAGCSTANNGDLAGADGTAPPGAATATAAAGDTTGSVVVQPAEPGPSQEAIEPLSKPGLTGDDPSDDLQRGKKYYRARDYGLAENAFRSAVEKHPRDAEAWVGLAASYDRLNRFDLADRAYGQAIHLLGPTPEILNDQGFSYMLRGDYVRARRTLELARAKDPANPYIEANLHLLDDSMRDHKAVQ